MHREVMDWLTQIKAAHPALFAGRRVLDVGSYDVNGTARGFFDGGEYVGLDFRAGPGVDVVSLAHEYQDDAGFDVVMSLLMLEHDPHWRASLANMAELCRRGGALLLAWAGPHWPAHEPNCTPVPGYYGNLAAGDVLGALEPHYWQHAIVTTHARSNDANGARDVCLLALNRMA